MMVLETYINILGRDMSSAASAGGAGGVSAPSAAPADGGGGGGRPPVPPAEAAEQSITPPPPPAEPAEVLFNLLQIISHTLQVIMIASKIGANVVARTVLYAKSFLLNLAALWYQSSPCVVAFLQIICSKNERLVQL